MAIIPAKDVGRVFWNMLESAVENTMSEATSEEKELAKVNLLNALSDQMFTSEMQ